MQLWGLKNVVVFAGMLVVGVGDSGGLMRGYVVRRQFWFDGSVAISLSQVYVCSLCRRCRSGTDFWYRGLFRGDHNTGCREVKLFPSPLFISNKSHSRLLYAQ